MLRQHLKKPTMSDRPLRLPLHHRAAGPGQEERRVARGHWGACSCVWLGTCHEELVLLVEGMREFEVGCTSYQGPLGKAGAGTMSIRFRFSSPRVHKIAFRILASSYFAYLL